MTRYLATRAVRAALTIWAVVTLVFLLVRLIPGDPVTAILGDHAGPDERAAMRAALGLDRPALAQYGAFLGDVADGSLGRSFRRPEETVSRRVAEVLPATARLAGAALVVAWLIALPLGVLAAARRGTAWDRGATGFAVLGLAIPHIWLGPLLILLFGVVLRWLPLPGDDRAGNLGIVLPALTIGAGLAAILTRQTRAAMIETLSEPFVAVARAKGLAEHTVVLKHALRNALLPVLTVGGAQLGALLSGAVIAEKLFERPGLGSLLLDAFAARDIPVVQGAVLVIAAIYVAVNLGVDLAYLLVDPRMRLA